MFTIEFIGYCAAFLTSASFLPQAILVIRTRQANGISLLMYTMFTLGVALWLINGITTQDFPIAIANGITLTFAVIILFITAQERLKQNRASKTLH